MFFSNTTLPNKLGLGVSGVVTGHSSFLQSDWLSMQLNVRIRIVTRYWDLIITKHASVAVFSVLYCRRLLMRKSISEKQKNKEQAQKLGLFVCC